MPGEAIYSSRWSVADGASPTINGTTPRWDFNSDSIKKTQRILRTGSLRGARSSIVANTRWAPYSVGGSLALNPSPAFLGDWLIRALGGGTTTAPAVADAVPEWGALIDRGTGTSTAYGTCYRMLGAKVNKLTLSSRASGLVDCGIDVLAKTFVGGETFAGAALGTSLAYEPYSHSDLVLTWDSATAGAGPLALNVLDWTLAIENGLTARFNNSLTADAILEGERLITLKATVAMATSVYSGMISNLTKDGLAATLALTNSTVSTSFAFSRLQIPDDSIMAAGGEFVFQMEAEVRGATGAELTVTNDLTP